MWWRYVVAVVVVPNDLPRLHTPPARRTQNKLKLKLRPDLTEPKTRFPKWGIVGRQRDLRGGNLAAPAVGNTNWRWRSRTGPAGQTHCTHRGQRIHSGSGWRRPLPLSHYQMTKEKEKSALSFSHRGHARQKEEEEGGGGSVVEQWLAAVPKGLLPVLPQYVLLIGWNSDVREERRTPRKDGKNPI